MLRVFLFCIFSIYFLIGIITIAILYNRWQSIKGFKRSSISILIGIIFWPWVIKVARKKEEFLKDRTKEVVSNDRALNA